jgi:hypothetical protein
MDPGGDVVKAVHQFENYDLFAVILHPRAEPARAAAPENSGLNSRSKIPTKGNTMHIFYRPQYQSDATLFIDQLKASTPGMEARQREGLALLWDKSVDRDAAMAFKDARVAQEPYVYQTSSK